MFLESLTTAFPATSYTQEDCLEIIKTSPAVQSLRPRSQTLLSKVLSGDSGNEKRPVSYTHLPLPTIYSV